MEGNDSILSHCERGVQHRNSLWSSQRMLKPCIFGSARKFVARYDALYIYSSFLFIQEIGLFQMKISKLQDATIKRRLQHLYNRSRLEYIRHKTELAEIQSQIEQLQQRCQHTKTHIESGQYLPCHEICNLCGAELA